MPLWRPNRYRTDDSAAACGAGRASGSAGRGEDGASESGALWLAVGADFVRLRHRGGGDVGGGCVGSGQVFVVTERAEKLKTWKTEKLTSRLATRPTRISGFQVFTRTTGTEILPNESGRGHGAGNFLNEPETV